jgi:peptidoglycan/xylan/chitin deacetylase (PgdA/CDA1 family)
MSQFNSLRKYISSFIGKTIGTITHVVTQEKVVALTFDDGPDPEYTPQLLLILEKHQAKATFFMVGQAVQKYPEALVETTQMGHTIGLHGWDHTSFVAMNGHERRNQILSCARVTAPFAQRIFRPPYGQQNLASHLSVLRLGYKIIGWSLDAADWLFRDSSSITEVLMEGIQPGSIILLHDSIFKPTADTNVNRQSTLDAVDLLLDRLGNEMKFVTVPELFEYGTPNRVNWYRT